MNQVSDIQQLVPALKQGDTEAYRELVRTMGEPLTRYAMRIVGDQATAQDVVQDALLRLYKRRKRLEATLELRGLCFRTVRNLARNHVRDESLRKQREQEADGMRGSNDNPGSLAGEAWELAKRLPAALREVIELRFMFGLSRSEIAATLEVPEGTVATRQKTALENLREQMKTSALAPAIALPGLMELLGTEQPSTPLIDLNLEELVMNGIESMKTKAVLMAVSAVVIVIMLATSGGAIVYGMANDSGTPAQTAAVHGDADRNARTTDPRAGNQPAVLPGNEAAAANAYDVADPVGPVAPNAEQPVGDTPTSTPAPDQPDANRVESLPPIGHQPLPDRAPSFAREPVEIAVVGEAYEYNILVSGNPGPALSAEDLPRWLTLDASTLKGTPAGGDQGLTHWLCLRADNGIQPAAEQRFRILVTAAPSITSTAIEDAVVGTEYKYQPTASGTPAPTFTLSGAPSWLSLKGDTLVGTPTADASGTAVELVITAENGVKPLAEQRFTLTVAGPPRFTSKPVETVLAGVEYRYEILVAGSPEPTLKAKGLPRWLTLEGNVLSGKPRNADIGKTGKVMLTASNNFKPNAEQTFQIEVQANSEYLEMPWTEDELRRNLTVGKKWMGYVRSQYGLIQGEKVYRRAWYEVTEATADSVTIKMTNTHWKGKEVKPGEKPGIIEEIQDRGSRTWTFKQLTEGALPIIYVATGKLSYDGEEKVKVGEKTHKCHVFTIIPDGDWAKAGHVKFKYYYLIDEPGVLAMEERYVENEKKEVDIRVEFEFDGFESK